MQPGLCRDLELYEKTHALFGNAIAISNDDRGGDVARKKSMLPTFLEIQ